MKENNEEKYIDKNLIIRFNGKNVYINSATFVEYPKEITFGELLSILYFLEENVKKLKEHIEYKSPKYCFNNDRIKLPIYNVEIEQKAP